MSAPRRGALWERIRATLERRAGEPAVTFLDARLEARCRTGGALLARVDDLAGRLRALRLEDAGPFGILSSSQQVQVEHVLAALAAGLTPALLTPPNRKLHMSHYLEVLAGVTRHCRFGAIATDVPAPGAGAALLEAGSLRPLQPAAGGREGGQDATRDASFLQFSSGTTGLKRGVCVADAAVLAQVDAYAGAIGLSDDDVIVSWLPLYHDMGFVACMLMPLVRGTHTVMLNPLDWVARPASYARAVGRFRGTWSWQPNFAFAFMADRVGADEAGRCDLSSLRGLVNCSEPATEASQRRFLARFAEAGLRPDVFCGCYAMAESTFALTHGRCADPGYLDLTGPAGGAHATGLPAVSAGRPLPGVTLEVVDEAGAPLPVLRPGEIRVRSPFNPRGYHRNPEASRAAIRDGWYHTGDVGYRVGDEVFVSGRRKELLIAGGVNVWPQDLERLACDVPGIHPGRAVAFSAFDPKRQTERIVLLAESDRDAGTQRGQVTDIRRRVLATLQVAHFEVHLVPPGWLSKSSSGKLARERNRERWSARSLVA